jgi:hypothetical protein
VCGVYLRILTAIYTVAARVLRVKLEFSGIFSGQFIYRSDPQIAVDTADNNTGLKRIGIPFEDQVNNGTNYSSHWNFQMN